MLPGFRSCRASVTEFLLETEAATRKTLTRFTDPPKAIVSSSDHDRLPGQHLAFVTSVLKVAKPKPRLFKAAQRDIALLTVESTAVALESCSSDLYTVYNAVYIYIPIDKQIDLDCYFYNFMDPSPEMASP